MAVIIYHMRSGRTFSTGEIDEDTAGNVLATWCDIFDGKRYATFTILANGIVIRDDQVEAVQKTQ